MKKFISLLAAIAMVSSLCVTSAFAYPASATVVANVAVANADQIEEYEDNVDTVPEGYTLLAIEFSQTGLGNWENTNTKTTAAQLKKPIGFLPAGLTVSIDFGADVSNLYADTDYYFVSSPYGLAPSFNGTELILAYGPWASSSGPYPLNANGVTAIAEGAPFAVLYVPVSGSATGTFTDQTVISMKQYTDGTPAVVGSAEYSTAEGNITLPASLALTTGPSTEPVTGVTVAPKVLNFTVGDAASTLTATVAPNEATDKSVTWTTSNASVATVANGVVTPVGVGSATITVTTTDGNFTDTCAVTVAAAPVPVTGVTLNKDKISIKVGETDNTLEATIAPPAADNTNISWSTSNDSVATVSDSGVVTGAGVGTAIITVTTEDGGYTDTCEVEVKAADQTIPAKNSEVGSVDKEDTSKTYTDLTGKTVTMSKNYGIAKFDPTVDTAGKNYFLHATDNDGKYKEWAVNFGELGVEATDVKVTFFAIVKSAEHIIETMELIARAK